MAEHFDFHYVKTPTGTISGQSVLKQTEDAINEVGEFSYQASLDAASALQKAEQAVDTANTANNTASNALTQVNAAVEKVNTLEVQVGDIAEQVEQANSKADQAVSTANSALSTAQQALSTANTALSNSEQAVTTANGANTTANNANSTAQDALEIAEEAKTTAESAVVDTDSAVEEMTTLLNQATQQATNATQQAQNAAASAASAASAAQSAVDDATEMLNAVVAYIPQNLTEDQQAQAREDIAGVGFEDYATASTGGVVKVTGTDGITINGSGEIAVDFSQMPTDKFEDLLKSIRVPIWLKSGKHFYVNGSTGSDTEDEDRGESASKPFKTIQKCINYIADNYNLSSYIAYVNIADGVYEEDVSLPLYNSATGSIQITGNSGNRNAVILRRIYSQSAVTYDIRHLTVQRTEAFANFGRVLLISAGRVNFLNVEIDTTQIPETSAGFSGLTCSSNAFCNISGSSSISNPGIFIRTNATTKCENGIQATSGGRINFNGNLNLIGDAPESFICASADNLSSIRFISSGTPYPVGTPTVINEGNKLGKRYNVRTNAIIDTSGQGPELFPGTIAGTTGSGGQYV